LKQYIEPFITVCKDVFREFLDQSLEAELPFFMDKDTQTDWDISAVIGLTGEARGAVVISMKADLAAKLTGILTKKDHSGLDDDVVDAVGEIVNIIAGNVKHDLEEAFKLVISLPTIIKGKGHSIVWPEGQARVICIPFSTISSDTFTLSIALEAVKPR